MLTIAALLAVAQALALQSVMPLDEGMEAERVAAHYFHAPPGHDPRAIAENVLADEGLTSWDGGPPLSLDGPHYSVIDLLAGSGRSVRVMFAQSSDGHVGICRVRAIGNGMGPAAYRATRWCAEKFGVDLPLERTPPIASGP